MVHVSWSIQQAHFAILLNSSEQDNHSRLVVPNHLPEVRDGGRSGTWRESEANKVQLVHCADNKFEEGSYKSISLCPGGGGGDWEGQGCGHV